MSGMKKMLFSELMGLLTGLVFVFALTAGAATYNVTVDDSGFSPNSLTIEVGDTVIWENVDEFSSHTSTSDLPFFNEDYWNGTMVNQGNTFPHTFLNADTFYYKDLVENTTGTITVNLPAPPGILLESPRKEAGLFLFEATGLTAGKTNLVQASTNLVSWTAIQTNIAASTTMTFTNPATLPQRFFRLLELP